MAHHSGLRQDSAAHKALCHLVDLGNMALTRRLMEVLPVELRSVSRFKDCVIDPLTDRGYALFYEDKMVATPKGKEYAAKYLARHVPVATSYIGQVALPRTTNPKPKAFNLAKHMVGLPVRDGAFTHQEIPSLMGNTRKLPSGEIVG